MHNGRETSLTFSGWLALILLLLFLAVSLWYAVRVWTDLPGIQMSSLGWTYLMLGVLVTTALGGCLMALVFYSSRHDFDR